MGFDGQGQSLPARIFGVIAAVFSAIAGALVSFFEWLQDRLPALQRVPATVLAAISSAFAVALVAVGIASGIASAPAPEPVDVTMEEEESGPAANPVNPEEPVDLRWRDTSFAVDPSFKSWKTKDNGRKVVYLTIDDGPSELTLKYLDLFDQYNVKATFFVTGHDPDYSYVIKEAYNRGHTIGLHTMTHNYDEVYASEAAYYADLEAIGKLVEGQIGFVPCFIRFPGGSSNTISESYSPGLMPKLVRGVQERGYQYYDWSLDTGDGAGWSTEEILESCTVPNGAGAGGDPTKDSNIILLCHDAPDKQDTYAALPTIIESYQKRGYTFEAIDRDTWVCHHDIYSAIGQEDYLHSISSDYNPSEHEGEQADTESSENLDETQVGVDESSEEVDESESEEGSDDEEGENADGSGDDEGGESEG